MMIPKISDAKIGPYSRQRRRNAGYTLIEALVAIVLVSIGIVAVFGGLRALAAAQTKMQAAELLQRLAMEEFNELGSITDPTTAPTSGDFTDEGYPDITWTLDLETTDVTNLSQMTIKTSRISGQDNEQQTVSGLIFVPPTVTTSSSAGTGGAAAGGGAR